MDFGWDFSVCGVRENVFFPVILQIFKVNPEIDFKAYFANVWLCIADEFPDFLSFSMDGADLCFEIVKRADAGFVYSEAVAR